MNLYASSHASLALNSLPSFAFICLCFGSISGGATPDTANSKSGRPNIVVILADDLGYGDTSVYDGWVATPQLQRLARKGRTFFDFHTNSSVCSPTRAAFLTGRYQQRVGIVDVIAGHLETPPLHPDQRTIADVMKQAGYRTAIFGKWHLGMQKANNPVHLGFDEFRGYLDGYVDYHTHGRHWHHNLEIEPQPGYSTHLITSNAVQFIEENADEPFFLYVSHEAVHLPFQTPEDTPEKRKPIPKEDRWKRSRIRPKYEVMLKEMDKGIGQILDTLDSQGIADDTLVFFFSDNGAIAAGSNEPFRGGKFSHYEGGHRVPAIAVWPGKIPANSKSDSLVVAMDLLPTFAELVGVELGPQRPPDGISVLGHLLTGEKVAAREVFFGYEPKLGTAMRDGHWKMIVKEGDVRLYNLSDDIDERENVADRYPKRAADMHDKIERWKQATVPGS